MKNPYDIYNDNRAHMGYRRGVKDALEEVYKKHNECDSGQICEEKESCLECAIRRIKEELDEK